MSFKYLVENYSDKITHYNNIVYAIITEIQKDHYQVAVYQLDQKYFRKFYKRITLQNFTNKDNAIKAWRIAGNF